MIYRIYFNYSVHYKLPFGRFLMPYTWYTLTEIACYFFSKNIKSLVFAIKAMNK